MKSSGNSSATASPTPTPRSATPPRKAFALTGRSAALDPLRYAVRPDLADVRLAEQVFAPHYAVAVDRIVAADTDLHLSHAATSDVIGTLTAGDQFELLDVIGDIGWGIATARGLVGYLPVAALTETGA